MKFLVNLASIIYYCILFVRKIIYKYFIKPKKLPCVVVSVGNVTLGGNGKTPAVEFLANKFRADGKKVVILSRGYKRKSKDKILVVSDYEKVYQDSNSAGDEPYMLALKLPGVSVIVGKDRYLSGIFACQKFLPDLIILDDGFQRRFGLYRDFDILMINSRNPFGNWKIFPAGILRESVNSLLEADVLMLTRVNQVKELEKLYEVLNKIAPQLPVVETIYEPISVSKLADNFLVGKSEEYSCEILKGKKGFAFSAIADNISYVHTLKSLKLEIIKHKEFLDHYCYTVSDLKNIVDDAKNMNANYIITTEKDAVRLPLNFTFLIPVYVMKIALKITNNEEKLWQKFPTI